MAWLGPDSKSGLLLRQTWSDFDAEQRFPRPSLAPKPDHPACICSEILRGAKLPADCRAFAGACTPERPLGACMVSSEGACAAAYRYGNRQRPPTRPQQTESQRQTTLRVDDP